MAGIEQLPSEFIQRLRQIVPPVYQPSVFSSFAQTRPTSLRANTPKISDEELVAALSQRGIKVQRFRPIPHAFILIGSTDLKELIGVDLYRQGHFYVQSLSSMLPPIILDPQPGEKILDLTAAPGSKTTQMAAMMGNTGSIIALESSQRRLYKLLANLKIQGASHVQTVRADARFFWREHSDEFDRVLLDAPCSGEGRINLTDSESFQDWSLDEIKKRAAGQKSLIFSAVNCLRPGGVLVYSTCTLAPEENEAIVDFALKKFPGRLLVEGLGFPAENFRKPLLHFAQVKFDPQIQKAVRIFPDRKFEGFFIARLRKLESSISI